jgi:ring-1,2-phenylacetyl-CoA epoxidase subunit PaaD
MTKATDRNAGRPARSLADDAHRASRIAQHSQTVEAVWDILRGIADPELPAVSMVDLGIVRAVRVDGEEIVVELMPTFLGCPAIGMMRDMVVERVGRLGPVRVVLVRDEPWTSARISEEGRRKLRAAGFAPPPREDLLELAVLPAAACPYCGSRNTALESSFGPTPCRAIHYCRACRQPFEQFKAV